MAIRSSQVSVSAAATRLDVFAPVSGSAGQSRHICVRNFSTTTSVYAGGANVTTPLGYEIPPGASLSIDVGPPEELWARTTAGSAVCHVIMTNVVAP
jgi:hypothetical protein